jgi:hypothetical protein
MSQANSPVEPQAEMRRKNLRLALILASVVAVFFVGFVVKVVLLGAPR